MKGISGVPSVLYIIVIALIVIAVIFLFFVLLGGKIDTTVEAIWDLLKGGKPNFG